MTDKTISESAVKEALSHIIDPDLHKDIVSLGFVRNVKTTADTIALDINLTTPACPMKQKFKTDAEEALKKIPGVKQVAINMTAATVGSCSVEDDQQKAIGKVKNIIAIASGKGGVGKSTATVNIAYALAKTGAKVGILDADVYGPSIPRMTGVGNPVEMKCEMVVPPEADGVKVVSVGMFMKNENQAAILRGPMISNIIRQFLTQMHWGELDYLLIDFPPGTGDVQLTFSQMAPITGAVIVTTPQEISLIDVRKAVDMFSKVKIPILGVIESMSYFLCDDCGKKHTIFRHGGGEKLSQDIGAAFLGGIPIETNVVLGGDTGKPHVVGFPESEAAKAYTKAAGATAAQVSVLREKGSDALEGFNMKWDK